MIQVLSANDELIVTKLNCRSRSVQQGTTLISELQERDIVVNILNMGRIDKWLLCQRSKQNKENE